MMLGTYLIALALGAMLLLKVCEKPCKKTMMFIGYFVVVLSFIAVLCSGYKLVKHRFYGCSYHHNMKGMKGMHDMKDTKKDHHSEN